jgi:hypothetical protein
LGSWASVTANIISFLRSKGLNVYGRLANALAGMAEDECEPRDLSTADIPAVSSMLGVSARAHAFLSDIPLVELEFASSLELGERTVEVPGRYTPLVAPFRPEMILLPDLRRPSDYVNASCKHECAILKKSRHASQSYAL